MSEISSHYPHSATQQPEIEALKTRYDVVGPELVRQAFAGTDLGLVPTSIEKPDSFSTRHVIYLVGIEGSDEPVVFRSNIGFSDSRESVLLAEKYMTDAARARGVACNEVIYVDLSRNHVPFDFQIQKLVPGADLEDHFSGTEADYQALAVQIGEQTALLHSVKVDGFGRFDAVESEHSLRGVMPDNASYVMLDVADELATLSGQGYISEEQSAMIARYFADRQSLLQLERASLVHYDIADHNIMFQENRITGLIDWEAAVASDPMLDIASMPTWKTHYSRLEAFLEGYRNIAPLPDNFDAKFEIYQLRTLLWKTVFCYRAGILTPERQQRLTNCLANLSQ